VTTAKDTPEFGNCPQRNFLFFVVECQVLPGLSLELFCFSTHTTQEAYADGGASERVTIPDQHPRSIDKELHACKIPAGSRM